MITIYMAIHHDEEYAGQESSERARAVRVARFAEAYVIPIRYTADGDTTYLEASLDLPGLSSPALGRDVITDVLDRNETSPWNPYAEFLLNLEKAGLGHLLHEVDTEAEILLLEGLLPAGDHYCSLARVAADYRITTE